MAASPEQAGVVPATAENIRRAAEQVCAGELVVVPTETVYGVAARPDSEAALARLYAAKGRDEAKRVAFFAADLASVRRAGARVDSIAERLAAAFWPGPLTLVLQNASGEWDGFRVPDHDVALAWVRELGFLPAVTSANRSGEPPALTAQAAWNALAPQVALALDAGPAPGGMASTVVRVEKGTITVLRAGPIGQEALAKVLAGAATYSAEEEIMPQKHEESSGERGWQKILYEVIFKADTPAGKAFDVALLAAIVLSVATVMLSSVESVQAAHGTLLRGLEWGFTILFTLEYGLRLACVKRPGRYATSFFGVVDFLSVIPTYLGLLVAGSHFFLVVRTLRMVRVFRILKLGRYVKAGDTIWVALKASRQKIAVFLLGVMSLVVIIGTLMYLIEGPEAGFTSIPAGVYWAIVTMTTVGYGDIAPQSILGQALASLVMILGYSIIAVPTGIVSVDLARAMGAAGDSVRSCPACAAKGHAADAAYCKSCGSRL